MSEADILNDVRLFLPKYLSPERQDALWKDLRSFPSNQNIYVTRKIDADLLQADGWRGFVAINFDTKEAKTVSGLVLSNSCDVDPANRRPLIPNITFVPLLDFGKYLQLLKDSGLTAEQLKSVEDTTRRQEVTSLLFLPAVAGVIPESVAPFGDIRSQPLDNFIASGRSLLFRMSDFGFYLFLFKLSIHFTRMMEAIER